MYYRFSARNYVKTFHKFNKEYFLSNIEGKMYFLINFFGDLVKSQSKQLFSYLGKRRQAYQFQFGSFSGFPF